MQGFLRPESIVLPEGAAIPSPNVITPPPNHFTHEAQRETPYFFHDAAANQKPDGFLPAGDRVTILRCEDGGRCRVVDERGLYVEVSGDSLRQL
jgi:hypothetical protein